MGIDKKTEINTVSIKKEPEWKLNKIALELASILEEEPNNDEALTYWRYVDSELKRRKENL